MICFETIWKRELVNRDNCDKIIKGVLRDYISDYNSRYGFKFVYDPNKSIKITPNAIITAAESACIALRNIKIPKCQTLSVEEHIAQFTKVCSDIAASFSEGKAFDINEVHMMVFDAPIDWHDNVYVNQEIEKLCMTAIHTFIKYNESCILKYLKN